tara:strand:+ start:1917 stop:2798 length:882 start_codon:yes stop_codon:yes gene_type:complete
MRPIIYKAFIYLFKKVFTRRLQLVRVEWIRDSQSLSFILQARVKDFLGNLFIPLKQTKPMKISIVLPCYNEELRIANTLKQIQDYTKTKPHAFEIILVDDGCTDKTVEVAKSLDSKIKIVSYGKNMGKGYAIKRGMLASDGEITLFMDADASADINELDTFLPYFKDHDLVIGSRTLVKGSITVPEKPLRRSVGFLGHKLISLIIRSKVKDLLGGFKAYNKKAKDIIFQRQTSNGMASDFEVIFLAEKFNLKIKELPIKWAHKPGGTAKPSWYTKALKELLMVRLNDLRGKYN